MNTGIMTVQVKRLWYIPLLAILVCLSTIQSIFSLLAFAICVAVIAGTSSQNGLCMLVFLMPFANVFKMSPESQSFFTYLMLLYVCRWTITKRTFSQRIFLLLVILASYTACQMLLSFNVLRMVKFFANFLLVYYALQTGVREDYKRVFLCYIFGIVCSSAVVALNLLPNVYDYIGEKNMYISEVNTNRFAGMYADPNYYAINVIISLCLVVLLHYRGDIKSLFAIVLAAALVTFAIMTYSRSAFLMLLLPLVLLLYSRIKKRRYFTLVVVVLAVAVLLFSVLSGKIAILEPILSRFDDSMDMNELTTGRAKIWAAYMQFFWENPGVLYFGNGMGAELVNGKAAHNTYIDVLHHFGVVGGGLLIGLLVALFQSAANGYRKNLLNYSVVLTMLIMYFFLSQLFYFDLAFHILLAIMVVNLPLKRPQSGSDCV